MLSKLRDLSKFKLKKKNLINLDSLTDNLSKGLMSTMESAFLDRKSNRDNSSFQAVNKKEIIKSYARKNMILAAATSVVPGPLGILGSLPELLMNMKNQMNMIYDLSCANSKESFLNKDLLLEIPFAAFGGNTNLSALQSQNIDLNDSPETILLEKATGLGKSMIERTLKKSIAQFVPVAGPIIMGAWSKMTTSKIANLSNDFFDSSKSYSEHFTPEETPEITSQIQVQKIKALANLIECNNEINSEQIAFIGPIIENAEISEDQKEILLQESLKNGSNFDLDIKLLKDFEEDENLVMELVIMAKRGDGLDKHERNYIFKVNQQMGLNENFAKTLLE